VLVRGAGLETIAVPLLGLAAGGAAILTLATLRYRKSSG
jgi:hypothetical protein